MISLKHQFEIEGVILIAIAVLGSIFYVSYKNNYKPQFNVNLKTPVAPVATEISVLKTIISSQISPDGMKKIIMRAAQNSDNTNTYNFSTADTDGANEKLIFTKILNSSGSMSIPFNAWSPDDKYFFIQENDGNNKSRTDSVLDKSVFVFKATGATFAEGVAFLDATDSFAKANNGNNFAEATGWASETLIIINTTKQDGSKGSSYWFEVPSKAVIQLSTEF